MLARAVARRTGAAAIRPAAARARARRKAEKAELRQRLAAMEAATADAVAVIIAGLEDLIANAEGPPGPALEALSACVFHDIVGQHMARVHELIDRLEGGASGCNPGGASCPLANGPRLDDGDGLDQDAIDEFF